MGLADELLIDQSEDLYIDLITIHMDRRIESRRQQNVLPGKALRASSEQTYSDKHLKPRLDQEEDIDHGGNPPLSGFLLENLMKWT